MLTLPSTYAVSTVLYTNNPVSTSLPLTPPTTFTSLLSVCHIPAPIPYTVSVRSNPHTITTLPAADSHTAAGCYHADTMQTIFAMMSIWLNLQSSDSFNSVLAVTVH
jgi:hypothetical protein